MARRAKKEPMPKEVAKYLQENYAGKMVYVPKGTKGGRRLRTQYQAVKILRRNKWTDSEICKAMHIYPSWLKKLMAS